MSHEIAETDANLREIARLRSDLATVRWTRDQALRAEEAERAARRAAEADAAALVETLRALWRYRKIDTSESLFVPKVNAQAVIDLLSADHPGASLLAELDAARAVVELMRAHYEAGGEVPGSFPARLERYDAARKARA